MLGLAALECLIAFAAVHLGAVIRFLGDLSGRMEAFTLWKPVVFALFVVVGLTSVGLYQSRQRFRVEGLMARILVGLGIAAIGLGLLYYALPVLAIGRGWWLLSMAITFVAVAALRSAFSGLIDRYSFRRRVLVLGAGKRASSILQLRRRSDQRGFVLVAFVPIPGERLLVCDERVDHEPKDVLQLAKKHRADEIVLAMDERRHAFPVRELLDCKLSGIEVVDILTFLERETGKVKVDLVNPSWIVFSEGFTQRASRMVACRTLDLIAATVLLLIVWPLMLLIALAIYLEDGAPVLYRQTRVGLLGDNFELLKFRSMTRDAEQGVARWAEKNDKRVTRVGSVIRRLRFDELPQLINVLRGDMRCIGPRPERPEFVRELETKIPYYNERHCVRPGLTGWAQLSYPYGSSEKDALEKLQFDLYYVKNQSLILDFMILLQTVEVVLWGKGAR